MDDRAELRRRLREKVREKRTERRSGNPREGEHSATQRAEELALRVAGNDADALSALTQLLREPRHPLPSRPMTPNVVSDAANRVQEEDSEEESPPPS